MLRNEYVEHDERLENGQRIFTNTIALKPVNWRKDGSLRRMTNLLVASGDPAMPIGCDELAQFRVDPRIAGKSPLIHFGKGQSFVKVALLNANNVSGVVTGNEITFVNAWNGADLRLANGGHFIQFVAPLKAGHPRLFSFRVDSHAGFDPATLRFGNDFSLSQPLLVKGELSVPLQWVKSQQGGKWILTVTLPAGDWAGWVLDPTLTLQPDAAAGVDTKLKKDSATTNYGTSELLQIQGPGSYTTSAILKFDLSSLAGVTIVSASLSLFQWASSGDNRGTARVHRILSGNSGWTEDGATWNTRDGTNAWVGSAGCSTADTDYASTVMGTMPAYNKDSAAGTEYVIPLSATEVATMVAANYGMLIRGDTSGMQYNLCFSDHATAAYRPKLVVVYTLPGGGGIFGSSVMHSAIFGQQLAR